MSISRVEMLTRFAIAKLRLEIAKRTELYWRTILAQTFDDVRLGTNISDDGAVKLVSRVNITLSNDKKLIESVMTEFAKLFSDELTADLITYEYKLSVSAYNELSDDAKIALSNIVTVKPGLPSVELIET